MKFVDILAKQMFVASDEESAKNKVYWDSDKITVLTRQMDAVSHRHWTLQLFFAVEGPFTLCIQGQTVKGRCVLVKPNVPHRFLTGDKLQLTTLFEPSSNLARQLIARMEDRDYMVIENERFQTVETAIRALAASCDDQAYSHLLTAIYAFLDIQEDENTYDERIQKVLQEIQAGNISENNIVPYARMVSLSPSRFSHLFKEEVGLPFKSYMQMYQMRRAFQSMLQGKSITEAAMDANFDSPSHFAQTAKKLLGTPTRILIKNSVFLKVIQKKSIYNEAKHKGGFKNDGSISERNGNAGLSGAISPKFDR